DPLIWQTTLGTAISIDGGTVVAISNPATVSQTGAGILEVAMAGVHIAGGAHFLVDGGADNAFNIFHLSGAGRVASYSQGSLLLQLDNRADVALGPGDTEFSGEIADGDGTVTVNKVGDGTLI